MTFIDFANMVRAMRDAQRDYFRSRLPGPLAVARDAERRVDRALKELLDEPLPLFDSGSAREPPKTGPQRLPESP